MKVDGRIKQRFEELAKELTEGKHNQSKSTWYSWRTSTLNLLKVALGTDSEHYQEFKKICVEAKADINGAIGVFTAAKNDYEGGYVLSLENTISGEIFGDFVGLAKQSLREKHKDVAAVLACAALEDALKRYALNNGIEDVADKPMQEVVNALKAKRLVEGAQKKILDTMPTIRDFAMHANWSKITDEAVGGVIGFTEQFILRHFSD
ncbi:MAG: DUF4145 domain-containing protein [Candidatus Scalindua sp.]